MKNTLTGELYKNKQKITILLIAADIFLLLARYHVKYFRYFNRFFTTDPAVGRRLCFHRGTKNDITGQKPIFGDILFLCHSVIA